MMPDLCNDGGGRIQTGNLVKEGNIAKRHKILSPPDTYTTKYIKTACVCAAQEDSMDIRRGDIYYADLSPVVGCEQGGVRPVLILQNNVGNKYSPTVIVAAITSQVGKSKLPTHIDLPAYRYGLPKDSLVLIEQVRTLDKRRLKSKVGHVDDACMRQADAAIAVSFGIEQEAVMAM